MPPILRVQDLHKSYAIGRRRVDAVRGVSFTIDAPGFWAIMGPSGSGKSTLLHLLAALDRPDRGVIEVAGRRIDDLDERALTAYRRREIGLVFQRYNLIPTLTALENAALPGLFDGVAHAARADRARGLLDRLGLGDRLDHRPDAMSGGEQQRVAIARALFFDPPVLFADEPTGNLDSRTSAELWSLLDELAREGDLTVLMVTHEPEAAERCAHVLRLRDGRLDEAPASAAGAPAP